MFKSVILITLVIATAIGWGWQFRGTKSSQAWSVVRLDPSSEMETIQRRELVEALDRVLVYEHYYHTVYGRFTKELEQVGFDIPASVTRYYEIRVAQANADHLIVIGSSEPNGKVFDLVSVDENFQIHANFLVPDPHPEYLRNLALRHLQWLKKQQISNAVPEQSIFKGFFEYSFRFNQNSEKVGVAIGILSPVLDVLVEDEQGDLFEKARYHSLLGTGQHWRGERSAAFGAEVGSQEVEKYNHSLSFLELIASSIRSPDARLGKATRKVERKLSSQSQLKKLEIEPVFVK